MIIIIIVILFSSNNNIEIQFSKKKSDKNATDVQYRWQSR